MSSDYLYVYGNDFNFNDIVHSGINKIIFNYDFDLPIDNLLEHITKIELQNYNYSQLLDNLPCELKFLKIYNLNYQHKLNNLPETLEFLWIGGVIQPLENLPNSLKILHLKKYFYSLDNLPNELEELKIDELEPGVNLDNLPNSIKILYVDSKSNYKIYTWPYSLQTLYIVNYNFLLDNLPNIDYIFVGEEYLHPIDCIPDSVRYLSFNYAHKVVISKLPANIKKIYLPDKEKKHLIKCSYKSNILVDDTKFVKNIHFEHWIY